MFARLSQSPLATPIRPPFNNSSPDSTKPSWPQCVCIPQDTTLLTTLYTTEDDAQKEEREEGNPVLFDGLRSIRHWYVPPLTWPTSCRPNTIDFRRLTFELTGRTTFVNTLCGKSVLGHKESDDPNGASVEDGVKIKPITVGA